MTGGQPNFNRVPNSPNVERGDRNPSSSGATQASPSSGSQTTSFQVSVPSISLPKGGGAIRGIGEKFAANPVTGTGSMTVPIATSPGRSGFGPQLSLSYDSGAGNGPFGLGWNLSLPSITRKTDKGLPKYQDADESDVFILSGAEDMVPVLTQDQQGGMGSREDSPSNGQTPVLSHQTLSPTHRRAVRPNRAVDKPSKSPRHVLALNLQRQHHHVVWQNGREPHCRSFRTHPHL